MTNKKLEKLNKKLETAKLLREAISKKITILAQDHIDAIAHENIDSAIRLLKLWRKKIYKRRKAKERIVDLSKKIAKEKLKLVFSTE